MFCQFAKIRGTSYEKWMEMSDNLDILVCVHGTSDWYSEKTRYCGEKFIFPHGEDISKGIKIDGQVVVLKVI